MMKIKVSRFMAEQYANPSSLFGRLITAGLLNRANQKSNQAVYKALDIQPQHRALEVGFGGGSFISTDNGHNWILLLIFNLLIVPLIN